MIFGDERRGANSSCILALIQLKWTRQVTTVGVHRLNRPGEAHLQAGPCAHELHERLSDGTRSTRSFRTSRHSSLQIRTRTPSLSTDLDSI